MRCRFLAAGSACFSAGITYMSLKRDDQRLLQELERLQQSSNLLDGLMDDPGRGIVILTPDRRIVCANATLQEWFPLAAEPGSPPPCHSVLHAGSDTNCPACPALRCMETGSKQTVMLDLASSGGKDLYRVSCTPLFGADGALIGVCETYEDTAGNALAEEAMQQYAARLEEKVHERTAELTASQQTLQQKISELDAVNSELKVNRDRLIRSEKLAAVGEMSATVAHGLRNPLVSIGGFARRLLKKEQADEASAKYLQIIVDETDRLELILSELLDFVRPRKLELTSVYLGSVIEDALKGCAQEFARHSIQVEASLPPGIPAMELDTGQFRHVLQNLFHNSIDAMHKGGVLHISTSLEDGQVKISIADTGAGIDDGDVEKVFHPFYTSKPSSTGLGLAVCNQIIAIHGGHIKLQRRLPRGVVFDIYLPLARPEAD
jgi:signal transduction histidine kinase